MAEPSLVFTYGPFVFIGASSVLSMALSPRVYARYVGWRTTRAHAKLRRLHGTQEAAEGVTLDLEEVRFERPNLVRMMCLLATTMTIWGVASIIGASLLLFPTREGDTLPAVKIDPLVLAHIVPTIAPTATERLLIQLRQVDASEPSVERLVLAAHIDPDPERAVASLYEHGLRSRAATFAIKNPSPKNCVLGLDAASEAMRGGALQELSRVCRNAPGESLPEAAFRFGDFASSTGPETESIISRIPRPPIGEPECLAGAFDVPKETMPLCRLLHAEMRPKTRREVLEGARFTEDVAARWANALRFERGDALATEDHWTIDVDLLATSPVGAIADVPIAVYEQLDEDPKRTMELETRVWIRLARATERVVFGRREAARALVDSALGLVPPDDARLEALAQPLVQAIEAYATPLASQPTDLLRDRYPNCTGCGFFAQAEHHALRARWAEASDDPSLVAELRPILGRFEGVFLNRLLALSLRLSTTELR